MVNGPSGPVGNFSLIEIAERQWAYIDQLVDLLRSGAAAQISPRQSALDDYDARRTKAALTTVFASGCRSWYLNAEGVPQTWPFSHAYFQEVMSKPDIADYEIV